MSHTMNIQLELHNRDALLAACQRLGLTIQECRHTLHSSIEEGIAISLPGWRYPAVVKEDGTVAIDNFNGSWGRMEELNKLKAYYGLEKAKIEARKKGYSVYETFNNRTQEIELRIQVGGVL